MLSPNFQTAQFQVEECNTNPVSITYKFNGTDKVVTKELFKVGSSFPSTKSVTFDNKKGGANLMVHYSEGAAIMEGLPTQIASYEIAEGKVEDKTEKTSFTMRISNNIHNIACLDEAELVQEWTEVEKIPIKASPVTVPKPEEKKEEPPKEGEAPAEEKKEEPAEPAPEVKQPEQQFETKERKKKTYSPINFTTANFGLSPDLRRDYIDIENSLTMEDREILETKELRNNLESYSYEMRNNLDSYGSWEKYLDEATRKTFLADINQVVDWLYGDGESVAKQEYSSRLDKFRAIGEPVKQRYEYWSQLEVYYS